jgi:3-deoxy-7-phosphoheptulonate synthase
MARNTPTPYELLQKFPLYKQDHQFIVQARETIRHIICGKDPRTLLIIGPCSVHNSEAVIEYAERLKKLHDAYRDIFYIVLRAHVEKPRTARGWEGFLLDPFLSGTQNIVLGIQKSRELFTRLCQLKLPIATELVNPLIAPFLHDLVSFATIGARTVQSTVHRHLAASLSMPIGFKNPLCGNPEHAIFAMDRARMACEYLSIDQHGRLQIIRAEGNDSPVLILRGSQTKPNYSQKNVAAALKQLKHHRLPQSLIIDAAHGNSAKCFIKQESVFQEVIHRIGHHEPGICGIMMESFMKKGNQPFNPTTSLDPRISLTDPCIDWHTTEKLLSEAYESLSIHLQPL